MRTGLGLVIIGIIGVFLTIFYDLLIGRVKVSFGPYSTISFVVCAVLILIGIEKINRSR